MSDGSHPSPFRATTDAHDALPAAAASPLPYAIFVDGAFTLHPKEAVDEAARMIAIENPGKLVRIYQPVRDLRAAMAVEESEL